VPPRWAHTDFQSGIFETIGGRPQFPGFIPPNQTSSGGIFGFQAGHNWQWGPVVGGLEIDFDGASINGTSTFVSQDYPSLTSPSSSLGR
jgi:hypothetical protein